MFSLLATPALQLNYKETFSMCTEKLQELLFSVNARRIDEEFDKFTTKLDTKPSSRVAEPREYIASACIIHPESLGPFVYSRYSGAH
jgi:hypothetical protein